MKLNEKQVLKLLNEAYKIAEEKEMKLSFTILDEGSNMLGFYKMDGAKLCTIGLSQKKAKTSVHFETDTKSLYEKFKNKINTNINDGYMLLSGGVPIFINEKIVGAMGASGDTGENDHFVVNEAIKKVIN